MINNQTYPLLIIGAGMLFLGAYFILPELQGLMSLPCPFHSVTGLYCPGCGTQRGLHALLHGELYTAMAYNPLMVISLPFLLYGLAAEGYKRFKPQYEVRLFYSGYFIKSVLVVVLLFWILRNIPLVPFSMLAPG